MACVAYEFQLLQKCTGAIWLNFKPEQKKGTKISLLCKNPPKAGFEDFRQFILCTGLVHVHQRGPFFFLPTS